MIDLNVLGCFKAVELVEKLQHSSLNLWVSATAWLNSRGANRIDLVHEDDGRSVLSAGQVLLSFKHQYK